MYLIKASYGNDSMALIQWMHEQGHGGVSHVVYNDTGWSRAGWVERVNAGEALAASYGMTVHRTHASFVDACRLKRAFPAHGMQFCTTTMLLLCRAAAVDVGRFKAKYFAAALFWVFPCPRAPKLDAEGLNEPGTLDVGAWSLDSKPGGQPHHEVQEFRETASIREHVAWAQSAPRGYVEGQRFLFGCDGGFCGT